MSNEDLLIDVSDAVVSDDAHRHGRSARHALHGNGGRPTIELTALHRLTYLGHPTMGALTFEPDGAR